MNTNLAVVSSSPGHSIHAYYLSCPESPDGIWILYFHSETAAAHTGELRIQHRLTGAVRTLASIQATEDAHRVACQQWVAGGEYVVFHDCRDGEWGVWSVEVISGKQRRLAGNCLVGWCQPQADLVPVYGPHWLSGGPTDVQLLDVRSGRSQGTIPMESLTATYAREIAADPDFAGHELSLFFPVLSPDLQRVFLKVASPRSADFRSPGASVRKWLVGYDLTEKRFLFRRDGWGHPFWHPDSRRILQVGNLLIDSATGNSERIPNLPDFPGSHPALTATGDFFATDVLLNRFEGGAAGSWGVVVGDLAGHYQVLQRFDHSRGASSWRKPHPHPAFSRDGRRLYFNVSASAWTQLHVVDCTAALTAIAVARNLSPVA